MEKIWGNLKKGLRFYCRENGFSDVILGLSGGLDSAVVSVLAAEALGAEHVYCLMMKTGYTSALSLEIARELAEMNKFNYRVLDIQPLVDSQQKFLTAALGTEPKKVVVENLQARERGKNPDGFFQPVRLFGFGLRQQVGSSNGILYALWRYLRRPDADR